MTTSGAPRGAPERTDVTRVRSDDAAGRSALWRVQRRPRRAAGAGRRPSRWRRHARRRGGHRRSRGAWRAATARLRRLGVDRQRAAGAAPATPPQRAGSTARPRHVQDLRLALRSFCSTARRAGAVVDDRAGHRRRTAGGRSADVALDGRGSSHVVGPVDTASDCDAARRRRRSCSSSYGDGLLRPSRPGRPRWHDARRAGARVPARPAQRSEVRHASAIGRARSASWSTRCDLRHGCRRTRPSSRRPDWHAAGRPRAAAVHVETTAPGDRVEAPSSRDSPAVPTQRDVDVRRVSGRGVLTTDLGVAPRRVVPRPRRDRGGRRRGSETHRGRRPPGHAADRCANSGPGSVAR